MPLTHKVKKVVEHVRLVFLPINLDQFLVLPVILAIGRLTLIQLFVLHALLVIIEVEAAALNVQSTAFLPTTAQVHVRNVLLVHGLILPRPNVSLVRRAILAYLVKFNVNNVKLESMRRLRIQVCVHHVLLALGPMLPRVNVIHVIQDTPERMVMSDVSHVGLENIQSQIQALVLHVQLGVGLVQHRGIALLVMLVMLVKRMKMIVSHVLKANTPHMRIRVLVFHVQLVHGQMRHRLNAPLAQRDIIAQVEILDVIDAPMIHIQARIQVHVHIAH
eukprot:TRINITY_DN8427_c0_g1_i8.p2 TRINITY_DN8427_c0_g1~~TRINITY_DN8427_c0_g1_i8.p2  ORF type:complete len:275 (-),score=17.13 TRINITY_DN8427_c0_g1_i8:95-919(-)